MTGEASDLTQAVRDRYGETARAVHDGTPPTYTDGGAVAQYYDPAQVAELPAEAVQAALGCGNPTALATLESGQVVLDLGSGGGLDALLTARRVGPTGQVFGLDMTDEMLALAEENKARAGARNVEFLRGRIEDIPLPADRVDVVISNCVLNLSTDKPRVLGEAFRVLRPGGLFAISDVVARRPVPEALRSQVWLWTSCATGALTETEYRTALTAAGFVDIDVQVTRVFTVEEASGFLDDSGVSDDDGSLAQAIADTFASAFVRARVPDRKNPLG